jgi:hypothetical protein
MKNYRWFIGLSILVTISLSCAALGTGGSSGGSSGYNTKFPMPSGVSNFSDMGNGSINFQVNMSLKDTIAFYRDAFKKEGLTERAGGFTSITDTTFSMIYDGDPNGKAIVIQGVDLGIGKTNVNIRFEKV